MSPYEVAELAGVVFGVLAVWLTVRESLWCWPTGLVYVALYIVVFHHVKLYAGMGLQAVYGGLCLYGWYQWLHGGRDRGALSVSRIPARALAILLAAGAAGSVLLGTTLSRATDASLPALDSSLTAFSLVAQAMVTRKWIENWILWIVVDVVYVGMYAYKGLFATAGLYALFLVLAAMGLREWGKALAASGRA
jgi:nicotinamide mononucleotide transporter